MLTPVTGRLTPSDRPICWVFPTIGWGATRKIQDVRLSRNACYLIVQNADPGKEVIALGQTYFAVHNTQLAAAAGHTADVGSIIGGL